MSLRPGRGRSAAASRRVLRPDRVGTQNPVRPFPGWNAVNARGFLVAERFLVVLGLAIVLIQTGKDRFLAERSRGFAILVSKLGILAVMVGAERGEITVCENAR